MSDYTLHLDRENHVCRVVADTSSRSSETWRMKDVPIVPLDPADIAWPAGERWAHMTEEYGLLPETTHEKEAA